MQLTFNCILFAEWWRKRQNLREGREKELSQPRFSIPSSLMSQTFRRWRRGFSAFWMISTLGNFKPLVSNRCLYLPLFFSTCLHPIFCMYFVILFTVSFSFVFLKKESRGIKCSPLRFHLSIKLYYCVNNGKYCIVCFITFYMLHEYFHIFFLKEEYLIGWQRICSWSINMTLNFIQIIIKCWITWFKWELSNWR